MADRDGHESNSDLVGNSERAAATSLSTTSGVGNDNDKTWDYDESQCKRNRELLNEHEEEDNPITTAIEPYFRLLLKLERTLTNEVKHLKILSNHLLKDTMQKGLQIKIRPAPHVKLNSAKQIEWETILMTATQGLQVFLQTTLERINSKNRRRNHGDTQQTPTIDESSRQKINFLDITFYRSGNRLETTLYRKKTDSQNYLHYQSFHNLSP
jgi:hypothetical protein